MQKMTSPWLDDERRSTPSTGVLGDAEIVVIGAGITGLTTAYFLALDGADVLLIDKDGVCAGTTGLTTGKVTSQHGLIYAAMLDRNGIERTTAYAEAQQSAIERIGAIVEREQIECELRTVPNYVYTEQEDRIESIEREAEVAAALDMPSTLVEGDIGLPWPVPRGLRFDDQLLFHPVRYGDGLADAIVRLGGTIATGVVALDVDEDDEGCAVSIEGGQIRASAVVVATQTPFISRGAFFARTRPARSYAIAAPADDLPPGMYISVEEPTRSIRPHPSGRTPFLILGGGGHPTGRDDDAQHHSDELEQWGRERFGMEPRWRWSAQDFIPADGVPFIGPVTGGSRRVFVATGYAKWGMTNGTVAGMLISDMLAGRKNPWHDAFDATRIDPVHSARIVASQGIETVTAFVKDRLTASRASAIDSVAPGSGVVVRDGGRLVAAYRRPDGRVQAVSATCTHMGCIVRFNDAEKSWDCPCHGSRFDIDGRVLDGPATTDLEQIRLDDEPDSES